MKHPEFLLVPVLMLLDYWLTVVGARLREGEYSRHVKLFGYELNPLFQKEIEQKRRFSPRHLAMVALVSGLLLLLEAIVPEQDAPEIRFLLGFTFGLYTLIIGRHLTNILIFRYVNRHTESMQGEISYSTEFVYKHGAFDAIGFFPLLAVLIWQLPNAFTYGLAVGAVVFGAKHYSWLRRMKSNKSREKGKAVGEQH